MSFETGQAPLERRMSPVSVVIVVLALSLSREEATQDPDTGAEAARTHLVTGDLERGAGSVV